MCILICLAHEGNAEDTFSLSGKLSNDNKTTRPGFLANMVRINKNRAVCDPSPSLILAEYKRVHFAVCSVPAGLAANKHVYFDIEVVSSNPGNPFLLEWLDYIKEQIQKRDYHAEGSVWKERRTRYIYHTTGPNAMKRFFGLPANKDYVENYLTGISCNRFDDYDTLTPAQRNAFDVLTRRSNSYFTNEFEIKVPVSTEDVPLPFPPTHFTRIIKKTWIRATVGTVGIRAPSQTPTASQAVVAPSCGAEPAAGLGQRPGSPGEPGSLKRRLSGAPSQDTEKAARLEKMAADLRACRKEEEETEAHFRAMAECAPTEDEESEESPKAKYAPTEEEQKGLEWKPGIGWQTRDAEIQDVPNDSDSKLLEKILKHLHIYRNCVACQTLLAGLDEEVRRQVEQRLSELTRKQHQMWKPRPSVGAPSQGSQGPPSPNARRRAP